MKDIEADVLIVGAGAAGLSAAYSLMNKGLKIVVLEKNICGGSSSGKSAGFLTPDSELELSGLIRRFGEKGASDLWTVATNGVKMIAERVKKHKIECDFVEQDSLFLGLGKSGWKEVQEELESRQKLNFKQTLYPSADLKNIISSDGYSGGVSYSETYGIDGLMYCQGMKKVLLDNEVLIFETSEVISMEDHCAKTNLGSVTADKIIFCADKLENSLTHFADNIYHAQTFLAITEALSDKMIQSIFPGDRYQCWDSQLVYTYFRLTGDNRMLLGGGDMLSIFAKKDTHSPRVINKVISDFKKKFPQLKDLRFIQYWPGRIDTTRDLLPTIVQEETSPWLHFVLGCVGLPWATFCGDFVARHLYASKGSDDHHYQKYFKASRDFLVPLWLEKIVGKQVVFSVNNGWSKYYQKDTKQAEH